MESCLKIAIHVDLIPQELLNLVRISQTQSANTVIRLGDSCMKWIFTYFSILFLLVIFHTGHSTGPRHPAAHQPYLWPCPSTTPTHPLQLFYRACAIEQKETPKTEGSVMRPRVRVKVIQIVLIIIKLIIFHKVTFHILRYAQTTLIHVIAIYTFHKIMNYYCTLCLYNITRPLKTLEDSWKPDPGPKPVSPIDYSQFLYRLGELHLHKTPSLDHTRLVWGNN